jgi:preprotein translocase subunit SecA
VPEAHRPWLAGEQAAAPWSERFRPEPDWRDRWLTTIASLWWRGWRMPGRRAWATVWLTRWHGRGLNRLDDEALRARADALRPLLLARGFRLPLVARAFALAIEATDRERGLRHHSVQILGAALILRGHIAEMATGEGKTITAVLAAAAAALAGTRAHVLTVNDYLARRDAEALRGIYARLGLSVGLAASNEDGTPTDPAERRAAYACDVVYGSNKEVAFDYLRDRIAIRATPTTLRLAASNATRPGDTPPLRSTLGGLPFVVLDEADSLLIDEARTPLIISGPAAGGAAPEIFAAALAFAGTLQDGRDFTQEPELRRIRLEDEGRAKLRTAGDVGLAAYWTSAKAREELIVQALSALHLFRRDVDYVVVEGKIQIVDASTGRVMPDRQWEAGLHQLVEAKEGCELSERRVTLGRLTYQRLYARYLWCGGMSGTVAEVGRELRQVYELGVRRVPTHRRSRRRHWRTRIRVTQAAKWRAVAETAERIAGGGRAVLIGTRSVADSERLSVELAARGLAHVVLNARQDRDEAQIVAEAGEPGRITVATAMAGRGTDIHLDPAVKRAGGLHVILTEFHESARVDRQLYGRAGRQGDPGSTEALVALDDALFRDNCPGLARLLRPFAFGGQRLPRWSALLLRFAGQRKAEAVAALARRQTLASAREFDRQLAFAERPD